MCERGSMFAFVVEREPDNIDQNQVSQIKLSFKNNRIYKIFCSWPIIFHAQSGNPPPYLILFPPTWSLKTLKQQLFQLMIGHYGESVHLLLSLITADHKAPGTVSLRLTLMERTVLCLKRQVSFSLSAGGWDSLHATTLLTQMNL